MRSVRFQNLLLLGSVLWAAAIGTPAGAATHSRVPASVFSGSHAWVAADLDGDRRTDLVSAAAHRNGSGYIQELTVRFGSTETSIVVRTAVPARRLSACDLDGDTDRDLILEAFDREPLAVLLNDGGGRFHLADPGAFRGRVPRREPRSFEAARPLDDAPESGEDAGHAAPAMGSWICRPHLAAAPLLLESGQVWPIVTRSSRFTRGPPRS